MEVVRLNIDSGFVFFEFGEFNKIFLFRVKDVKWCLFKFLIMDFLKRLVNVLDGGIL